MASTIGLDIGGANLKAADGSGAARSAPFAVWRAPERLAEALEALLGEFAAADRLAVTMTAELCDCFETRRAGVLAVLDAVERAAAARLPGAEIVVWRTDAAFAPLAAARRDPLPAAAANWLALARVAAGLCPAGPALLADMGSTTTDVVAIRDRRSLPLGVTDSERLKSGELVYSGLRRTPVFGIARVLPWRGAEQPLIPELFATALDARLLLGDVPEDPSCRDTANGRPATRDAARDRLARAIGVDRESFSEEDALEAAGAIAAAQDRSIRDALEKAAARLGEPPGAAVLAGEGEHVLAREVHRLWPRCELLSLRERFGPERSRAACAWALVELLRGQ
jgi:hypothetical protein